MKEIKMKGGNMTKKLTTIYLDIEQLERLNKLSSMTKITKSAYIREAFDLVLKKYENEINRTPKKIVTKNKTKSEKQERRGFFRVLTNLKGQYIVKDKKNRLEECTIINIHHKGIGLELYTPKKIKVGSSLTFDIFTSDKKEPITIAIKGKVKWMKERKRYFIGGIAVTSKKDEEKLAKLIRLILGIKREGR
jgi:hypothetical protein